MVAYLSYQFVSRKKFINNYKYTMLAQYLVSLGATNSQKLKRRMDKAVNSLQESKERIYWKVMHRCPKIRFTTVFQPQACS